MSSRQTIEESDSDSEDEGIGLMFGGKSRHDLMMTDEKVKDRATHQLLYDL